MNENEEENGDDLTTKCHPTATLTADNVEAAARPPNSNNKNLGHHELIGDVEDAGTATKATTRAFRLAEKRRTSTCAFANRVARLSIDHYQRHVPLALRVTQTCLATLVAHETATNELHVLAMGVGTKFLTQQTLQLELELDQQQQQPRAGEQAGQRHHEHQQHPYVYGSRVRDGHAEVLCRRAVRRYLTESILHMAKQQRQCQQPQESKDCAAGSTNADNQEPQKQQQPPFIILQPVMDTLANSSSTPRDDMSTQRIENDHCNDNGSCSSWQLRPGITLHAYCSSAPCGNAVLKKFTSMKREVYCSDLTSDTWPRQVHAPMLGHAIRLGEFALLLKKDRSSSSSSRGGGGGGVCIGNESSRNGGKAGVDHIQEEGSKLRSKVPNTEDSAPTSATATCSNPLSSSSSSSSWPARQSTNWCPPGTTTVWAAESDEHVEESGSLHTCSDKLCRWNCLGWQGSLLSSFIPLPIHVETITVGRKLSAVCCRRAVCCRVERQQQEQLTSNHEKEDMMASDAGAGGDGVVGGTTCSSADKRRRSKRKNNVVYLTLPYKVNHPAILGTDVYMDETGMIEVSSLAGAEEGQDVRFHSSVCWAWWPGLDTAEAINGTTGFAMMSHDGSSNLDSTAIMDKKSTSLSRVSTASLVELFLQARDFDSAELKTSPPVSLSELREFKHLMSPVYENAKDMLLKKHPVLRQWKRRAPRNTF